MCVIIRRKIVILNSISWYTPGTIQNSKDSKQNTNSKIILDLPDFEMVLKFSHEQSSPM